MNSPIKNNKKSPKKKSLPIRKSPKKMIKKSPKKIKNSPIKNNKKSPIKNNTRGYSKPQLIYNDKSFINCIEHIKNNMDYYKTNSEDLLDALYSIIINRKDVDKYEHPLIDKTNLYKSAIVYSSTQLSKDDINDIKHLIKKYKNTDSDKYKIIKHFLKDVKFEKYIK